MEGIHDVGGMQGFGIMPAERDDAPFHEAWQPTGYVCIMAGVNHNLFTIDAYRHSVERILPRDYLTMSYYERMLTGVASLYVEAGVVTREELESRAGGHFPLASKITEGHRAIPGHNGFEIGQAVKVRIAPTPGHCRIPAYAFGRRGVIVGIGPATPFASEAAHVFPGEIVTEPTYHVRFEGRELWPDVTDDSTVTVDLFQSYLEAA